MLIDITIANNAVKLVFSKKHKFIRHYMNCPVMYMWFYDICGAISFSEKDSYLQWTNM